MLGEAGRPAVDQPPKERGMPPVRKDDASSATDEEQERADDQRPVSRAKTDAPTACWREGR